MNSYLIKNNNNNEVKSIGVEEYRILGKNHKFSIFFFLLVVENFQFPLYLHVLYVGGKSKVTGGSHIQNCVCGNGYWVVDGTASTQKKGVYTRFVKIYCAYYAIAYIIPKSYVM